MERQVEFGILQDVILMTLDMEYMEKVRSIMADASSYYGDAILEPIERMAEKAPDSPRHSLCLGRIMMVCADSDAEVAAAMEFMNTTEMGRHWLNYVVRWDPDAEDREAAGRTPTYGSVETWIPMEMNLLEDITATKHGHSAYSRFGSRAGGFENGTFVIEPRVDSEDPYSELLTTVFVFKPTGLKVSMSVDSEDEWMKEEAQWDCFSNQNITSREFSHVLRLCVESVFATIRGMVP